MKQPRKDVLRDELARAATTIEEQRKRIEQLERPWWRRLLTTAQAA